MAKGNYQHDTDYATPVAEMVTMFRLNPRQMREAGIAFVLDANGAVEIRGEYTPMQIFDAKFIEDFRGMVGDRESDEILDKAGAVVQREMFLTRLRKIL